MISVAIIFFLKIKRKFDLGTMRNTILFHYPIQKKLAATIQSGTFPNRTCKKHVYKEAIGY